MKTLRSSLLLVALLGSSTAAVAETAPTYNRINFSVAAETDVQNDRLVATLFTEAKGKDTKVFAKKVNEAITWGLAEAKKNPKIEARTLNYSTNPFYNKGRVSGWQVRQSIQLKSSDSNALSAMLGELQQRKLSLGVGINQNFPVK